MSREYECKTSGCGQEGTRWTIDPRRHRLPVGLIEWPQVVCAECEVEPQIVDDEGG